MRSRRMHLPLRREPVPTTLCAIPADQNYKVNAEEEEVDYKEEDDDG
jgi:hypothetical protein